MGNVVKFSAEDLVLARMNEFFTEGTPWTRHLWQVGTVMALREVLESAEASWSGALSRPEALDDFKGSARRVIISDPTLISVMPTLTAALDSISFKKSAGAVQAHTLLGELVRRIERNYLWSWSEHLTASPLITEDVELVARLVGAHLLDLGFHGEHLVGWLASRAIGLDLPGLLREAQVMQNQGVAEYSFLAMFGEIPAKALDSFGADAVDLDDFLQTCKDAGCEREIDAPVVGVARIRSTARDVHAALESVAQWLQRYETRVRVGLKEGLVLRPLAFDEKSKKFRPIREPAVPRLRAVEKLLMLAPDARNAVVLEQLDDALAHLSPRLQATRGVSVATLWAAAEGLLGSVEASGASVATKLARIVACSYPREEIHYLAVKWKNHGTGNLRSQLKRAGGHFQMLEAFHQSILSHGDPGFDDPQDAAAVNRLLALSISPQSTLKRVEAYCDSAFRRLYYQRNFVMHASKFDSVSLGRTADICPRLVAAGLDQIVNAQTSPEGVTPHALAARATAELDLLSTDARAKVFSLLS